MFLRLVTEKAAFAWLREKNGDTALLLSRNPYPWEPAVLWIGRINSRADLRAVRALLRSGKCAAACWHAGHPSTERLGQLRCGWNCGRKYLGYVPDDWLTKNSRANLSRRSNSSAEIIS